MGRKTKQQLSPEFQKFIDEHPEVVIIGMMLAGVLLMQPSKKGTTVPGLGGRRNGAWRGKGSFGKAPFGGQGGHKR